MVLLLFQHTFLIHLSVEANYLFQGKLVPGLHLLPCIAQAAFQLWGQPEVDLLPSYCTNQCQPYTFWKNHHLQELWG